MSITDELREWMFDHTVNCSDDRIALVAIADRIEAELAERYMELPVDADGVPIHVGDELEGYGYPSGGAYCKAVMGWGVMAGEREQPYRNWLMWSADALRHHHEPTVEGVLEEFSCVLMGKREFDGDVTKAIAEYAAKLCLKENE